MLFAQTTDEIIGVFRPGSAPTLHDNTIVDADSVLQHENGHRELCQTSVLGIYLSGLSLATVHVPAADNEALRSNVESLIQQCWVCQEGYATFKQIAQLEILGRTTDCKQLKESLPESYKSALRSFYLINRHNGDLIARSFSGFPVQSPDAMKWLIYEHVAFVVGMSAMSLPLIKTLEQADSLPHYDVIAAVRNDPPDVRLPKLVACCNSDFIEELAHKFVLVQKEVHTSNSSRPLDELLLGAA